MKTILKRCLTTVDGRDCVELFVNDSLFLTECACDFCDYRDFDSEQFIGEEEISCSDIHGCGELSSSYFVLLDLKTLIVG